MFTPNYHITNTILNKIASIEAAREIIENAPLVPYWERQFREERVVRTVHYSTSLEGNPLNIEEVRKVLRGDEGEVKAYSRDIQEVINYRNVIKYISANVIPERRIGWVEEYSSLSAHAKKSSTSPTTNSGPGATKLISPVVEFLVPQGLSR